jgi:dTDP-4-dehydrorhamnose reductase
MTRIIVTGGSGQFASAILRCWKGAELVVPAEALLDLNRPEAIHQVVTEIRPHVVVNAGALTAVDRCETEVALANRINGQAVGWLAEACTEVGALLVQISTDYVFDGMSPLPYRETDIPNPLSVYGRSKLLGEQEAARTPEHLIVRTAWLYDAWGKNFFRTMLNAAAQGRDLKVVADQVGTPTTCRALARQLQVALKEGWRGLVHGTCHGETSWHGFAEAIFRQSGVNARLAPCSTGEFPVLAPRPAHSVLDGSWRSNLGTDLMPTWQDALAEVIQHPEL